MNVKIEVLILQISRYGFLILTGVFALLYFIREDIYQFLIREDNYVEWLTCLFLFASGIVSYLIAITIRHKPGCLYYFFILFSGFSILAGLEEISWGQRIFGWETKGIFKYSDQHETNLHNTMQGIFRIKTKHIALVVLFCYGVILPWLTAKMKINVPWVRRNQQFFIPPTDLSPGFFIASLMMLDLPTGNEEEIGEFFYSMCFLLMTLHYYHLIKHSTLIKQSTLLNGDAR